MSLYNNVVKMWQKLRFLRIKIFYWTLETQKYEHKCTTLFPSRLVRKRIHRRSEGLGHHHVAKKKLTSSRLSSSSFATMPSNKTRRNRRQKLGGKSQPSLFSRVDTVFWESRSRKEEAVFRR